CALPISNAFRGKETRLGGRVSRPDRFSDSWGLNRCAGRFSRRRLMAILRASVRVLGIKSKQRGLGLLTVGNSTSFTLFLGSISISMLLSSGAAYAQALGGGTRINGSPGMAVGNNAVSDTYGVAVGPSTYTSAANTVAIGNQARATAQGANAFGAHSTATGQNSISVGLSSRASGTRSSAV